ncbi:hypothetical protein, partial [Actinoalloteichus spitiensis]|uniref:hypothetical protein n=1 Tax=Actinoalloteichus spitiensis TaxID=252394 RepID=UPI000379DD40
MWSSRQDVLRLFRIALRRPPWHLALALVISAWTLAWIVGHYLVGAGWSPLRVPEAALAGLGVDLGGVLSGVREWLEASERAPMLRTLGWLAGVAWAATTRRAQFSALLGWIAVMVAAEGLGYHGAVHRAVLGMVLFMAVLYLLALPFRRAVVDRTARLLPPDVLSAGSLAAALAAVVPLLLPAAVLRRVLRPYLTLPPRLRSADLPPVVPTPRSPVEQRFPGDPSPPVTGSGGTVEP